MNVTVRNLNEQIYTLYCLTKAGDTEAKPDTIYRIRQQRFSCDFQRRRRK